MAANIERFKNDLIRLIQTGKALDLAMLLEISKDDSILKQIQKALGSKKKADEHIKALPNFKEKYESWYSESLVLLKQLLPDRMENFVSLYEIPKSRKEINYGNYVIQDYMKDLKVTWGTETKVDRSAALPQFRQQTAILKAAGARFESSLFEIRQLVQADLFDSEIDAARELLKGKFLRAAGMVAGVVLEKHLRQVCQDHTIKITKSNPGINDLNDLLKGASVIDVPQWRHISFLGDIRNICGHKKSQDPTVEQVTDLVEGTDKVLKTIA